MRRAEASRLAALLVLLIAWGCRDRPRGGEPPREEQHGAGSGAVKETTMSSDYSFTEEQKSWMMKLARESVTAAAEGRDFTPPEPDASWKLLHDDGAAFVTLRRRSDGSLRGCIGHIIARVPLHECIAEMGRAAAIHDSRFSPVTPSELGDIHLEISVLTPLQPVADPEEIVVGKDGVVLRHGYHQGVFLPQVPVEQGWDRKAYLDNLCYKAGMMREGCWKDDQAELEKFQAIVWEEED
jgi:AmmeMemoRadiSam system protein A